MYLHECVLQALRDLEANPYTYAGAPTDNRGFDPEDTYLNAGAEYLNRGFRSQAPAALPPAAVQLQRGANVARQLPPEAKVPENIAKAQPTESHGVYANIAAPAATADELLGRVTPPRDSAVSKGPVMELQSVLQPTIAPKLVPKPVAAQAPEPPALPAIPQSYKASLLVTGGIEGAGTASGGGSGSDAQSSSSVSQLPLSRKSLPHLPTSSPPESESTSIQSSTPGTLAGTLTGTLTYHPKSRPRQPSVPEGGGGAPQADAQSKTSLRAVPWSPEQGIAEAPGEALEDAPPESVYANLPSVPTLYKATLQQSPFSPQEGFATASSGQQPQQEVVVMGLSQRLRSSSQSRRTPGHSNNANLRNRPLPSIPTRPPANTTSPATNEPFSLPPAIGSQQQALSLASRTSDTSAAGAQVPAPFRQTSESAHSRGSGRSDGGNGLSGNARGDPAVALEMTERSGTQPGMVTQSARPPAPPPRRGAAIFVSAEPVRTASGESGSLEPSPSSKTDPLSTYM